MSGITGGMTNGMTSGTKKTALVYSPNVADHLTGPLHPERPERIAAAAQAIQKSGLLDRLALIEPRPAAESGLLRVHAPTMIARVRRLSEAGGGHLDYDTVASAGSYEAGLLSVGAALTAADAVLGGGFESAFALARPPGHHATRFRSMGFCLFNGAAAAARYAQEVHGVERVLVADWDVHHGNGTQDIFYEDPSIFYFSIHQHPHYPGTGMASERGRGKGAGATLNVPLPPGSGDLECERAFEERFMPAAEAFRPDLIIVSAGFDAHALDPLGGMLVSTDGFGRLTDLAVRAARELCGGRLVSVLEGGYRLSSLGDSVVKHLERLCSSE